MIIVDSNIVFSSLLVPNSHFLSALIDDKNKFISPYFLFIELFKHKEKLLKHTKISQETILEILDSLLSKIQFVPLNNISLGSRKLAYELCRDIEYDGLIWTGDKKLMEGLKKKGFNQFFIRNADVSNSR